jgi:protein gp37
MNGIPSIEPMMGDITNIDYLGNTDWVIIGAESGNRKDKVKLDDQWLRDALVILDNLMIPVFVKINAGGGRQEYPMLPQGTVQS